ncbi:hypothetical protein Rhopal_003429-T1 [Rhodotorula paludigena]|uniref:RNase III domain-containing protein n=1 Tax=Rhodotorula paludigena TaxID=86838 RepID=A0AAV5GJM6_9BASI|nr:hypothetical protein Rhopal_003429-T1 [Rhodotorula paludigena]
MPANLGFDAARAAIISYFAPVCSPLLPELIPLEDSIWRTHSSYYGATHWTFEAPEGEPVRDYERLEHVGDALLGAEVALLIDDKYPRLVVGVRALVKSALVENSTLALLSSFYKIPPQILTAQAPAYSIQNNPNVQACVFEAYLAQLHAEKGAAVLRTFLRAVYDPLLNLVIDTLRPLYGASTSPSSGPPVPPPMNYIGRLQEWSCARGTSGRLVHFAPGTKSGADHNAEWTVTCSVEDASADLTLKHVGAGPSLAKAKAEDI